MKRLLLASLLMIPVAAHAQGAWTVGLGFTPCSEVTAAETYQGMRLKDWFEGEWSGMNVARDAGKAHVGSTFDINGVFVHVMQTCYAHPTMKLSDAVTLAYIQAQAAHQ